MVSSRWEKRNTARFNIAYLVLVASIMVIGFPVSLYGLKGWLTLIALIIGLVAGVALALTLLRRNANSMIRVLKFDYKEIERDFRILFKDNNIYFNRETEEDAFHYYFPGHSNLGMTVQAYERLNLDIGKQKGLLLPATKIMIGDLNTENKAFAEKLAVLIDDMAKNLSEQ